jgi:purine-binding chemotaxis protein CheW
MAIERLRRSATDEGRKQYCTFWLAGRLYGVDILDVKEVNPEAAFTEAPHAPKEVCGFVNIRGQIHLILDLRRILGLKEKPVDEKSRLVLFKPVVGESFGVLVDSISDVVEVEESLIETGGLVDVETPGGPSGEDKPEQAGPISAVCRLKNMLLLIINARSLLKVVEKAVAGGAP